MKPQRHQDRKLELIGKAKPKREEAVGFVEKKGRHQIVKGKGNVEIFFPLKEDRRSEWYTRRVFQAEFLEYLG